MRPHDDDTSEDEGDVYPTARLTRIYHTERAHRFTSVASILSIISAGFINTLLMVVPDVKFEAWVTDIKDEAAKVPQYPVYVHDKAFSLRTNIGTPCDKARYGELNKARVVITKYSILRKEYDAVWGNDSEGEPKKSDFFRQHWSLIVLLEADRELLRGPTGYAAAMMQVVAKGKRYVVWAENRDAEGGRTQGERGRQQQQKKKQPMGPIRNGNIQKRAAKRKTQNEESADEDLDENGAGPSTRRRAAKPKKGPAKRLVNGVLQKTGPVKKKQKTWTTYVSTLLDIDNEGDEEVPEGLPPPNQSNKITSYFQDTGNRRDSGQASGNTNTIFIRDDTPRGVNGVNEVHGGANDDDFEQVLAGFDQHAAFSGGSVEQSGRGENPLNLGWSTPNMFAAPVVNGADLNNLTMNGFDDTRVLDLVAGGGDVIDGEAADGGSAVSNGFASGSGV
jgi:hypothetical protein